MPMRIIYNEQDRSRPRIYCDECGKVITKAVDGNYEWNDAGDMWFSHKECYRDHFPYSGELATLPIQLIATLDMNYAKEKKSVQFFADNGLL